MLWTVMPLNLVIEGSDTYQPSYLEITRNDAILIVEEMSQNTAKVIRVISSNPNNFLDPKIQPGNLIQISMDS